MRAAVERPVGVSRAHAWAAVRDFGDISWIPVAGRVDVEGDGPGMRRSIHGSGDGPPVVERLISRDDEARTIEYTIDANNPLPVSSYVGTVTVTGDEEAATIHWSATFEPDGDEAQSAAVVELMLGTLVGWLADALAGGESTAQDN